MNTIEIVRSIDAEIARLRQARQLLAGEIPAAKRKPSLVKRVISPEGRARIAAAQKARWKKLKAA